MARFVPIQINLFKGGLVGTRPRHSQLTLTNASFFILKFFKFQKSLFALHVQTKARLKPLVEPFATKKRTFSWRLQSSDNLEHLIPSRLLLFVCSFACFESLKGHAKLVKPFLLSSPFQLLAELLQLLLVLAFAGNFFDIATPLLEIERLLFGGRGSCWRCFIEDHVEGIVHEGRF